MGWSILSTDMTYRHLRLPIFNILLYRINNAEICIYVKCWHQINYFHFLNWSYIYLVVFVVFMITFMLKLKYQASITFPYHKGLVTTFKESLTDCIYLIGQCISEILYSLISISASQWTTSILWVNFIWPVLHRFLHWTSPSNKQKQQAYYKKSYYKQGNGSQMWINTNLTMCSQQTRSRQGATRFVNC